MLAIILSGSESMVCLVAYIGLPLSFYRRGCKFYVQWNGWVCTGGRRMEREAGYRMNVLRLRTAIASLIQCPSRHGL